MLCDMEATSLEVALAHCEEPKFEGHMKRVVQSRNPLWYRKFCAEHSQRRKGYRKLKTYIKRGHVLVALEKISKGIDDGSIYIRRLMPYIENYAKLSPKDRESMIFGEGVLL